MKSFCYKIQDEVGIHARPAGLLVKEANRYQSRIVLKVNGKTAQAARLMAVMSLNVKMGQEVFVEIEGEDEEEALRGMKAFFENNL